MKCLQVLLLLHLPEGPARSSARASSASFPTMFSAVKTRTVKCYHLLFSLECWQTSGLRLISFYWRKDDSLGGLGVWFYWMLGNARELPLPLSLKLLLQSIYWNKNSVYKRCWRNKSNLTLVVALLFTQDFLQLMPHIVTWDPFSCILKYLIQTEDTKSPTDWEKSTILWISQHSSSNTLLFS